MDDLRVLLYPAGYLAQFCFGARFIVQWLASEKAGRSEVTASFWKLSIAGNILLFIHAFIQIQLHLCLVQASNFVLGTRNLNLMEGTGNQVSKRTTLALLITSICGTVLLFAIRGWMVYGEMNWVTTPTTPWTVGEAEELPLAWHVFGTAGMILFAVRFWIQWWQSESTGESTLTASFWWISTIGAVIAFTYFCRLRDTTNIIGYGMGLIPYLRNLMLIRNEPKYA